MTDPMIDIVVPGGAADLWSRAPPGLLAYRDVHGVWLAELIDAGPPGYRLTHWRAPGNTVLTAADAGGAVAAYAWAAAPRGRRARMFGPQVLPEHRGRRLGLWVSAALLRRLRAVHPHVDEVETARLLAVHQHLGFQSPVRRDLQ